ncbi:Hypothetical protein PHPALM_17540 [Phytophthora palmivora]|uniref:Uncharacterized protein n=1 Tax=Phytophthora palmivora TaxID=4796 RepID=A0A2P4XM09_9STRA|nr:Hypothetical protein PHPALM_17540 [Phytophthora palmivora]
MTERPDDTPREKRKRLTQQALDTRTFPPQLAYPEILRNDSDLVALFSQPVLVWIPGVKRESRKPPCVVSGCRCDPSLKELKLRVIEDVDCKYNVLYIKYQCTGNQVNL